MMSVPKYRRKNYLVDKGFQYRFVASFLVLIIISLFVFTAGMVSYYWIRYMAGENVFAEFIYIQKQVRVKTEEGQAVGTRSEMQPPINRLELILPPILINNLVIMVIITVIGLFYSHRIAGPVFRIEQDLSRVLDGETGVRIRLRKKDALKSLANKINQLIEKSESQSGSG
jgi:methyl-accepting chemotaxis protein